MAFSNIDIASYIHNETSARSFGCRRIDRCPTLDEQESQNLIDRISDEPEDEGEE